MRNYTGGRGHKDSDSLMSIGWSTIAVDIRTISKLKELAGDMPVNRYLKGLAFGDIKPPSGGNQEPLPGQELAVSDNTLPAISAKLNIVSKSLIEFSEFAYKLDAKVDRLMSQVSGGRLGLAGYNGQQSALVEDATRAAQVIKGAAVKAGESLHTDESQLNLEGGMTV